MAPTTEVDAPAKAEEEELPRFKVKELVEVSARTHPGFNLPGGTARVAKVRDERVEDGGAMKDGSTKRTTGYTYDVRYVLGGSERRVDAQFIRSKVLATRQELNEERREDLERKKLEKEKEEKEKAKAEKEKAERRKLARNKLATLRAAKALNVKKTTTAVGLKNKKKKTPSSCERETKEDPKPPKRAKLEEDNEDKEPLQAPPVAEEDEEEEEEQYPWLRDVLAAAPRDPSTPDEVSLESVIASGIESDHVAHAPDKRAAVLDALRALEAANHLMLVDDVIFIV